ncbi:cytochrome c biogenesis protein [Methanofollis aquaemaris]|uniref:cytochrome c biogenesis protein n=1 Tax=Methanofollis aquaemaris TaxID=126734 RepID=UPI0022409147|nr:cytochrome c biogenesis protein [Methanofollis aquaemaris]
MNKPEGGGVKSIRTGLFLILFLTYLIHCAGASPLTIEYYSIEGCSDCDLVKPLIEDIECDLDESVSVTYIDVRTPEGLDRWRQYGFREVPAVVVDGNTKIPKDEITEERIRAAIEQSFSGIEPKENLPTINWNIPLAYSLGLFSGFSPCLMAILGFILVYVTGSGEGLRSSVLNSLVFGLGLVATYIIMGCCVLLVGMSLNGYSRYLTIAAGLIVVLVGMNLIGILRSPIDTGNYIQSFVWKYSTTLPGLFILGVLFSIVKAPCAAPMILILLSKILVDGTIQDLSLLLVFGVGLLTPFIGVGMIGGYSSSRRVKEHRDIIKIISGIILIGFGFWMIMLM